MFHTQLLVKCDPEFSEILMAELAEARFDTFLEVENGFDPPTRRHARHGRPVALTGLCSAAIHLFNSRPSVSGFFWTNGPHTSSRAPTI